MEAKAKLGLQQRGEAWEPGSTLGSSSCLGWLVKLSGSGLSGAGRARSGALPLPSDPRATPALYSHSKSSVRDNYRVSKVVLGRGKYGTVRKATARKTGRQHALKTVNKTKTLTTLMQDPVITWTEILIQAACNHPHIVRIHESFESLMHLHFVMEICNGGNVLDLLKQGSLSEADARLVMKPVLRAVRYLHGVQRVAHRDVKPGNLLLKFKDVPLAENCVKLTDFGLAESLPQVERNFHVVCGTPAYMAPEMLSGLYDERCDLWSCGVTFHKLLSGRLPFEGTSVWKILATAGSSPLGLHDSSWLEVSPSAKALLRSMCDIDVSTRVSADKALKSSWFLS